MLTDNGVPRRNAHTFENEAQTARKNRFDFPKRFCFFYCILSFIE